MQVQVNFADVKGSESLEQHIREELERSIGRYATRITRVEVHVSDHNGVKHSPNDKRCLMEARPAGHEPFVIEHHGDDFFAVVSVGADKLERVLSKHFDKLNEHHPH
ncbi:MAG: HPF/RaiA family ribosome-associated protein [Phycisphaeraceae bacterium]|nr:HPF/RaiA family ribosome-associated protein [Phycisphaeraceae bacterium]MCW5763581.1 HPF/RaiA family ribosome-associated protein [Phycisphaeraceae bacterium]